MSLQTYSIKVDSVMNGAVLIAVGNDSERNEPSNIVIEPLWLNPLMTNCCAWAGKMGGCHSFCLELFVTFCFKAKSKGRKN